MYLVLRTVSQHQYIATTNLVNPNGSHSITTSRKLTKSGRRFTTLGLFLYLILIVCFIISHNTDAFTPCQSLGKLRKEKGYSWNQLSVKNTLLTADEEVTIINNDEYVLPTESDDYQTVDIKEVPNIQTPILEYIQSHPNYLAFQEKIGTVDDERIIFPELQSGEVPRFFSSLEYTRESNILTSRHAAGSTLRAGALVAGTTIGAGVLALPTATAPCGILPSSIAMGVAWIYMTMSGLLIAELSLNRMGDTGRTGGGLLDLYKGSLGVGWGRVGSVAYFFLHYAVLVAYIAQGGLNVNELLPIGNFVGFGQVVFAGGIAGSIYWMKPSVVEKINSILVGGVFISFLAITSIGARTADMNALFSPINQHPSEVVNAFPILFLSMVYHNIVPTIVTQLEGDRSKIIRAIIGGTSSVFVMLLVWNAVILGNVVGSDVEQINPVALLQSGEFGGPALGSLVTIFSELALVTSVIGFVYGLTDSLTDVAGIANEGPEYETYKPLVFAGVFLPPLALSIANPGIFFDALDYGGAFGVSTLFLVLPSIMAWKERYGEEQKPVITKPLVPFGKISLASMWKAAATLIFEQGADKIGLFDFIGNVIHLK